jgi:hypothetical protein
MSRRQFLAATGSAGLLGLAGCAAPTNDRITTSGSDAGAAATQQGSLSST